MTKEAMNWLNMCSDFGSENDKENAKEIIQYIESAQQTQNELIEMLINIIVTRFCNMFDKCHDCYSEKECASIQSVRLIEKITGKKWEDIK
jgi:hypothetical protein